VFCLFCQSSVCSKIMEQLGQEDIDCKQRRVAIISQESFYRELNEDELEEAHKGEFNFDHPGKNEYDICSSAIL